MAALDKGWIPRGSLSTNKEIERACHREDNNEYFCVIKNGQLDSSIRNAVRYILETDNASNRTIAAVLHLTSPEFLQKANELVTGFFSKYYTEGATCDFGGIAMLVETKRSKPDDFEDQINHYFNDDEYFEEDYLRTMIIRTWVLALSGLGLITLGCLIGFVIAMRSSARFNEMVRKSPAFKPITSSQSELVRVSLNLPKKSNYEEIQAQNMHRNGKNYHFC